MKPPRKTLSLGSNSNKTDIKGSPLKQMTITESFKKAKKPRFSVSTVIIEIDSDSDVETPPLDSVEISKKKSLTAKCEQAVVNNKENFKGLIVDSQTYPGLTNTSSNDIITNTSKKTNKDLESPSCSKPGHSNEISAFKENTSTSKNDGHSNQNKTPMMLMLGGQGSLSSTISHTDDKPSPSQNISPAFTKIISLEDLNAKEGKQLQIRHLKELVNLFDATLSNDHFRNLLSKTEYDILKRFKELGEVQQYVLMKLFVWKRSWYNTDKFCRTGQIQANHERDMHAIFLILSQENFVDKDYIQSTPIMELLNELSVEQIKNIMKNLRMTQNKGTKQDLIQNIIKETRKQATLTKKTRQDMVLEQVEKQLGLAIKIKQEVHDTFYNAYLLTTFTSVDFDDIQTYFNNIIHLSVAFPAVPVTDFPVFASREIFLNYVQARQLRRRLEAIEGKGQAKFMDIYNLGLEASLHLQNLQSLEPDYTQRYMKTPHLKQFSAQHVYCSILTNCCETIFAQKNGHSAEVKKWLEFMIANFSESRRLGTWYFRLVWMHMSHLRPISFETAADLLIEAFTLENDKMGDIIKFKLASLTQKLKSSKSHKIDETYHDRLAKVTPKAIDTSLFPHHQIDSQCIRSDISGKKRVYLSKNSEEVTLKNVEQVALHYYAENGYPEGEHCEGSLVKSLLILYFWDIIYNPDENVPGTFISKFQSAPLDIFTSFFYENRKVVIDARLLAIDVEWSEEYLIKFGEDNYQNHSHEMTPFGMVRNSITEVDTIGVLVTVIGRKVLAQIFRRLITNIREFSSGMPDLLVWNVNDKIHKFIEVKGEGDRLNPNQILWLDYLHRIGASIEVCWVHSVGSKRKKIKTNRIAVEINEPASDHE